MIYLLIVSIIWAFSFGLIKGSLTGLDSNFVAFARISISFILFLPFLRLKNINYKFALQLIFIGMIQYGLMYISYIFSFQFLMAYQVALFTIFTPIYVTLINDILNKRFKPLFFLMALLSIFGTAVVVFKEIHQSDLRWGFLILQVSNICFAFGQIYYKKIMTARRDIKDFQIFGLLYFGALLITGAFASTTTDWINLSLSSNQVLVLLYLGVLASGICFFLWNYGAKRTNAGSLAIFNNVKMPLAVTFSILVFHEQGNIGRLLMGGLIIIAALIINDWLVRKQA